MGCAYEVAACLFIAQPHLLMFKPLSGRLFFLTRVSFLIPYTVAYRRLRTAVMAEALPPLSRQDRDTYARMGTTMEYFHNGFRDTWKVLYGACSNGTRPANMSIRQFLNTGSEFAHHLTIHHTIGMSTSWYSLFSKPLTENAEEQHIFPVLAQRMPAFRKELELLTQHKQIHNGLDKFEAYVDDCKAGKRDMRLDELKDIMDSFGTVLWAHLQDEVDQLSADNMRKYWTLDEVKRLPM